MTVPGTRENQEKILQQKKIYEEQLRARITELRAKVIETNARTLHNRSINMLKIVESLKNTNERVIKQHEDVRRRVSREAIRRELNVQVNRGLKSLDEFISVLRTSNITDLAMIEAIQDPAISSSPIERIRRASVSNFVKSIQRQAHRADRIHQYSSTRTPNTDHPDSRKRRDARSRSR